MNRTRFFTLGLLLVLAAGLCYGQKIGFVDSNRALQATEEGKLEIKKIQDWADKQAAAINDLRKRGEERATQLRNQQNILADDKKEALTREIDALETEYKRRAEDYQKEVNARMEELYKRMDQKITPLFIKYAQDNGYTLILYINNQVLAYYDPKSDVTEEIIKIFNEKYPVTGAAAPAAK